MSERLNPIVLGLGAVDGYSGDDLTNARDAVTAGEVPYAGPPLESNNEDAPPALELRVHGVGGAPPERNLQSPAVVQVSGDATAGFYRAWYPGGRAKDQPLREAYCWGGLNTRSYLRGLYLVLIAFMFVNVAYWALPAVEARSTNPKEPRAREKREPLGSFSRGCVRVLGLALTIEFFGIALTILANLVAWQSPQRKTGATAAARTGSTGALPSWLGWIARYHPGTRVALALLLVLILLGVLMAVSIVTARSYEAKDSTCYAKYDRRWPLTHPNFWRAGARTVNRQRNVHVIAVAGLLVLYAGLPSMTHDAVRDCYFAVAAVFGVTSIVLIASPWTERHLESIHQNASDQICIWGARLSVVVAIAAAVSRVWLPVEGGSSIASAFPGDGRTQNVIVFATFGIALMLALAVVLQRPWRRKGLFAAGMAGPLIAALGATVATIFGSSLTLAVANMLGTPEPMGTDLTLHTHTLLLSSNVYAGSLGMVIAVVVAVLIAVSVYGRSWIVARRLATSADNDVHASVSFAYAMQGATNPSVAAAPPARAKTLRETSRPALRSIAGAWAQARQTDFAGVALALLVLPTSLALVGYLAVLQAGRSWSVFELLAKAGGLVGVAATVAFFGLLRSAITDPAKRRRFGFLWDVGTFWPRTGQPFAPPSYAERAIPEVATRIRRITGDSTRGPEVGTAEEREVDPAVAQQAAEQNWMFGSVDSVPTERHCRVLLTGYSQGAPIAFAVLAQLPAEVAKDMALLTLNAPVRRLYGQVFPAYFGVEQREALRARLVRAGWMNMVRYTDYIGGWVFEPKPPRADLEERQQVDQPVMDPPVGWLKGDLSAPPMHRHSSVFSDPQLRSAAVEMRKRLTEPSPQDAVSPKRPASPASPPADGGQDQVSPAPAGAQQ